ncbi:MAG: EAL domain-containing protein, partial [Sediminispirochaetaceae bacterium]
VKNMHEDSISHAIVEAINSLGHFIGIQTIAEFVANEAIISKLREIGVNYAQGFHVGRPAPLVELLELEESQT